jgi:hypothetical protein
MSQTENCLRVIMPYKWNGLWVFDDALVGLEKEALVCGIDDMLDRLTEGILNRGKGVLCVFSDVAFPGHMIELTWLRHGDKGTGDWYYCEQFGMEGWLCPALLKYFKRPPVKIFARITAKPGRRNLPQPKNEKENV